MADDESERQFTRQVVTYCTTAILMFGILVGGATTCSINGQDKATLRVMEVCKTDIDRDVVRALACLTAVQQARTAGN